MNLKCFMAIIAVAIMSPALAQTKLESLGQNDKGDTLFIETKTIRSVEYPKPKNGVIFDEKATYREVWVRAVKDDKITGQYLWLFDCLGSGVQMAAADSTDLTARAKATGVESLLRRIPPDPFFELVQTRVCKK